LARFRNFGEQPGKTKVENYSGVWIVLIKRKSKLQLLCTAVISFFLVNTVDIHLTHNGNQATLNIGQEAQAKRGGGRSGGGSFNSRRSSSSRSSRASDSDYNGGSYSSRRDVYIVSGGSAYGYYSPMPLITLVIILGILAIAIKWAIRTSANSANANPVIDSANHAISESEIENNIVTISKIQVGLLATARTIQTQLSEYSLNTDTETLAGLAQLLQEAALALLRTEKTGRTYRLVPKLSAAENKRKHFLINFRFKNALNLALKLSQTLMVSAAFKIILSRITSLGHISCDIASWHRKRSPPVWKCLLDSRIEASVGANCSYSA
jgi:uncharacterized membrane protein